MNTSKKNNKNKNKNKRNPFKLDLAISRMQVCPDSVTVPLTYFSAGSFTAAYSGQQLYSLNSVYDPDISGSGTQPVGFDQWSAFYNRYRVDKVQVEVDFANLSTISATDVLVLANNDNASIATQAAFQAATCAPFANDKLLNITGSGQDACRIVRTYDIAKVLGVDKTRHRGNPDYSAVISANPTESCYLHIVAQDVLFNSNISLRFKFKITYLTTFFDRNQLAQS